VGHLEEMTQDASLNDWHGGEKVDVVLHVRSALATVEFDLDTLIEAEARKPGN
jgi:hypothetical protein